MSLRTWTARQAVKAAAWILSKSYGEGVFASTMGAYGSGTMPGAWSGNRIEQIQHYRHWVYKAINLIMTLATKEPPSVVRVATKQERKDNPTKAWLGNRDRRKAMQVVKPHEELEFLGDDHQLQRLLKEPNEQDTGADLIQETLMYLELTGNAYVWPVPYKNAPGVAELWAMPSHWMWPHHTGKTNRLIDYYEMRPWGTGVTNRPVIFDADEIIHLRYKSPLSKIDGQSPLQAAAEMVDTYESVQLSRFFQCKNGANLGTVLEADAGADLTQDMLQRAESKWLSRFQGEFGFNRPAILPPGFKLNRPAGDWELAGINSADQLRDYVLGMWGLTKSVVGFMDEVNRAAFEAALAQVFYLVINPRLSMIANVFNEKLTPRFGKDLRIFWRDMSPADRATEATEWAMLTKAAPYKGNELRQWMGLEPLDEGDEVITPMSVMPGNDPFGGMSDEDLMSRVGGIRDGGQGGGAEKRFQFNGKH